MDPEYLTNFTANHSGSQLAFEFYKGSTLHYISLQNSTMNKVLQKFPEVLLILRCHNSSGRALYIFLADGPCLHMPTNVDKIVHVALPKDETNEGLTLMFQFLKDFNTCWPEFRVFLVDPHFKGADAIQKVFPSAEIVLSAYHLCRYLQQNICQLPLPDQTEHLLIQALKNTMCSATSENLTNLHMFLNQLVKPDLLEQLQPSWLLEDRIWAMHRWRPSSECLIYFQNVESLSLDISRIFNCSKSITTIIKNLVEYIQAHTSDHDVLEKRHCTSFELDVILAKDPKPEGAMPVPNKDTEAANLIGKSLQDLCTPAALDLCQKELEIAQKSVRLMGLNQTTMNVQLLESPNEISYKNPSTCTCNFNQAFKLPCRHMLAVFSASKEKVQPEMLHSSWRKRTDGAVSELPISYDTLEILMGEKSEVSEKELLVESLSSQLSQLLAECSDDVFEQRCTTLRELADAWIGPYEEVKL
ncbi:zinc finger SWIM domain-containing protein 1 [Gastrophryne carolinensis]